MSSKVQKPWRIYQNVAEIYGERFVASVPYLYNVAI